MHTYGAVCPECSAKLEYSNDAGSNWDNTWYVYCPAGCHKVEGLTIAEALECLEQNEGDDEVPQPQ